MKKSLNEIIGELERRGYTVEKQNNCYVNWHDCYKVSGCEFVNENAYLTAQDLEHIYYDTY